MNGLVDYVSTKAIRGACKCGRCIDASPHPETQQPNGHTVNLTFFEVASRGGDKAELLALVRAEHPELLDGAEHNYLEVGGKLGDQGLALMLIGLGHVLGAWKALSPHTMLPDGDDDLKIQMAGMGMVSLQYAP